MKAFFALMTLCLVVSNVAAAYTFIAPEVSLEQALRQDRLNPNDPDRCQGQWDEDCRHDYRTCIARDAEGVRYLYTASYGYPNKAIVNGAIAKCQARSNVPATCKWAACKWPHQL